MNYTMILKKGESILSWIYKNITNKFTGILTKLNQKFPIIGRYPLLKYSLIPLLVVLFLLLRYIIKFVINEFAAWTSGFIEETAGYTISEREIVISIAVVFIASRIVALFYKQKKEKGERISIEL